MLLSSLLPLVPLATLVLMPQDGESQAPPERTFTPQRVVTGVAPAREHTEPTKLVLQPTPEPQTVVHDDDGVPLPIPAVFQPGPDGDRLVREASGDPFFLGFSAGPYHPPETELVDPLVLERYLPGADQRPGDFTYAVVMFSRRMTDERLARLEAAGCRLLGFHPHYTVKVALPPASLAEVSTLPFVRWVGAPQAWQKLSKHAPELLDDASEHDLLPFHVTAWESDLNPRSSFTRIGRMDAVDAGVQYTPVTEVDQRARIWQSNGWMHAALEQRGIQVESYAPSIDAFQVRVTPSQLPLLLGLDFVLFVEPELVPTLASAPAPHDESTAMVMSDRLRMNFDGGTNQAVNVGIIDSGVETDHADLVIWAQGWACDPATDPFDDDISNFGTGHGTHVSTTILGRGVAKSDQLGNAPGIATWGGASRYFVFRGFKPGTCVQGTVQVATDIFANDTVEGDGTVTPKPMVVNNSWGYTSTLPPDGTEANCRTLDKVVYENDQMYVFCSGNEGGIAASVRIEGSAKNVLTVGAVVDYIHPVDGDPGQLWTPSSRGPTGDNRWKPNIVAPGTKILGAVSNNNNGYSNYSGTSMATPHVTAAAAMICDQYAWARYEPALLASLLMAGANTNNAQLLTLASDAHLDTYGAGRMNVYKASYNSPQFTHAGIWGFELTNANWMPLDFQVPVGTTRLVVVMTYVEEACSSGAPGALVNNYDMYLDRDPIDSAGNTGDYSAHQSSVDNTEIRILDNPISGAWRCKVYPTSANSNVVKVGVTAYVILGDLTPNAVLSLAADDVFLKPDETVNVTAGIDVAEYIGSSVVLARSGDAATVVSSSTTLYDGVVTDLLDNAMLGQHIVLGDVLHFDDREGTWGLTYPTEGTKAITVDARSDNMVNQSATLNVVVDGTDPGAVTNLGSPSHVQGGWSNDPTIDWTWTPATDNLSGIEGYALLEYTACSPPSATIDLGPEAAFTGGPYTTSNNGRYFNIRSVDKCGNLDADYECDGPYFIDLDAPPAPTFLSSSHTVGGKSCNPTVTVDWNAVSDAHSGVKGYGLYWNSVSDDCPGQFVDTTGTSDTMTLNPGTWYLHIRTKDVAGNWTACADAAHFGPFIIIPTCTLFQDDFESGDFAAGGWTISSTTRCKVNTRSEFTGAFGARLKKGGQGSLFPCEVGALETWIEMPAIDTTGFSGVELNMDAHFRNNEGCEVLTLEYWDGAGWTPFGSLGNHAWANHTFSLPAGAVGNPALRIRMITNAKGKKERAEVDNVEVVGLE